MRRRPYTTASVRSRAWPAADLRRPRDRRDRPRRRAADHRSGASSARASPPARGPGPAAALRGLDAVLLSHAHWDHLDLPSLERLGKELPIVCPKGVSGLLRRKRFAHVTTLEVGEEVRIGALVVRARARRARREPRPAGSVGRARLRRRRVADGVLRRRHRPVRRPRRARAARPRSCPRRRLGLQGRPGHLDPERAAEAVRLLQPRVAVPIHWGTLAPIGRAPDPEPPHEFARLVAELRRTSRSGSSSREKRWTSSRRFGAPARAPASR